MRRKVKAKIFQIHDPIYSHGPIVAIGATDKQVIQGAKRAGYEVDEATAEMLKMVGEGRTMVNTGTGLRVLRLSKLDPRSPVDVSVLAHEACHMATILYDQISTPLTAENDEPHAYYASFIVREVLRACNPKRRRT